MSLTATTQQLNLDEQVTLYRLDATKAGAAVYYFCQADKNGLGERREPRHSPP